ncbi:hypothetical protein BH18VER1_BH18VER1_17080 [soil metagenome]
MNQNTRTPHHRSGFALVVTLVMMALIVTVVVAYLANTGSDRSTSSAYASRLRAKMIADSGAAAATKLLYNHTKYGNYITAMAPPAATGPDVLRTEIYRPNDPIAGSDADFLRIDNAIGDVLASVSVATATAQVDARPPAAAVAVPGAGGSWGIADPGFTAENSYNFNQTVRVGTNDDGRLVHPDGQPAYGHWVNVRDTSGGLIGRYAFFIEDESMKVNINTAGNKDGSPSAPHLRVNDLLSLTPTPAATPTPSPQLREIDPSGVLASSADRSAAIDALIPARSAAPAGSTYPLASKATVALLDEWKASYPDYAHLVTAFSKDDNTTARGWLRLDVNKLVADVQGAANPVKVGAASTISNWITSAWTGPQAIGTLGTDAEGRRYQLFNDERLRAQIAASVVDYIDADNTPTDMGDMVPDTGMPAIPVIGIEKIPYLVEVMVMYQAKERAPVPASSPARTSAKMSMKFRFNFINLFEQQLRIGDTIRTITVTGTPPIMKSGETVFDKSAQTFTIAVADLRAVTPPLDDAIEAGENNTTTAANSGVRTFETDWLVLDETVQFRNTTNLPVFSPPLEMKVSVLGEVDARLDVAAMTWSDTPSMGFRQSGSTTPGSDSAGDFLRDAPIAAPGVTRTVAAIFSLESLVPSGAGQLTRQFADPRYRPQLLNERWRRQRRTDTESTWTSAVDARLNRVNMQLRTFAVDWYDENNNRPLAFIRNARLRSIGELGHISVSEYPWRTLYLQHPERPTNSTSPIVFSEVQTNRRGQSLDWVLPDLFRTSDQNTRSGAINVNTRFDVADAQRVLDSLFLNLRVGEKTATEQLLAADFVSRLTTDSGSASTRTVADRRKTGSTIADNDPLRPFFQIGQLASVLSRLFSTSMLGPTEVGAGGTSNMSTVTYSVLRNEPENTSELNENYRSDMHVEQGFREVSDSVTARGNVFRVLYVGQAIKDIDKDDTVDANEVNGEYLGEVITERVPIFTDDGGVLKTTDSQYRVLSQRPVTE